MKFKLAFAYGLLGLLVSLGFAGQVVVYSNDFEHAVGPEWSSHVRSSTPVGARQFLGEFSSGTVTLTLSNLPPHTEVSVRFDLFILKSWDGQGPEGDPSGPDKWGFSVADSEIDFITTFSNHLPGDSSIYPEGKEQKYPNEWPDGENMPPYSCASEVDSLGYTYHGRMDAVYSMTFVFDHDSDRLEVSFWAELTGGISDESWGLDNIAISLLLNEAPTVDAGPDLTHHFPPEHVRLAGSVQDDGLPKESELTTLWSVVSGPGPVVFEPNEFILDPMASLSLPGVYVLRLTARDGQLEGFDEVTITYTYDTSYVDGSALGTNNGSSWENAFTYLQDALTLASAGTEIRVAEGTYTPGEFVLLDRPSLGRAETFELKNGVVVYGGFPAGGGTWEERNQDTYPTILSGDLDSNDDTAWPGNKDDNSYHVVTANRVQASAGIDGFTIVGGNADAGSSPHDCGGGMYIGWASPTIRNCLFKENNARKGGAIWAYYAGPIIEQCRFEDNSAISRGGAVYSTVYAAYGSARIMGCEFKGNAAGEYGGAVYCDKSRPHALNSLFHHNSAKKGAALYSHGTSEARLTNCTLSGNTALVEGGGAYDSPEATTTLGNCILWGNTDAGSAVWAAQATGVEPDIYYCTIQGWIGGDPLFADPDNGDYHLKSAAGRWDPALADWVIDDVSSPAIDAGSPFADVGDEPEPHGGRINQGAYGGTAEASKSLGPFNIADLNRDGVVDIRDHAIMAENWLRGLPTE